MEEETKPLPTKTAMSDRARQALAEYREKEAARLAAMTPEERALERDEKRFRSKMARKEKMDKIIEAEVQRRVLESIMKIDSSRVTPPPVSAPNIIVVPVGRKRARVVPTKYIESSSSSESEEEESSDSE